MELGSDFGTYMPWATLPRQQRKTRPSGNRLDTCSGERPLSFISDVVMKRGSYHRSGWECIDVGIKSGHDGEVNWGSRKGAKKRKAEGAKGIHRLRRLGRTGLIC